MIAPAMIAVAALVAPAAAQAPAPLAQVSQHLKGLTTMTAAFTQTSTSGNVLRGQLTLARPGKVRFQYEPGVPLLVVADGKALTMIDYEVAQVSRWPIRGTPLAVLLDPTVDLARFARVLPAENGGVAGFITVEARDPKHPEYGTITLYFSRRAGAPAGLQLAAWRVLDAQGAVTQVQLSDVRFGVAVDRNAFAWRDPRRSARPGSRG
jgi:outer membrane lipoprotein-sorting protein